MTKEEFLMGMGETPTERLKREDNEAFESYSTSDEGVDELLVLIEMDCYDGPLGNA